MGAAGAWDVGEETRLSSSSREQPRGPRLYCEALGAEDQDETPLSESPLVADTETGWDPSGGRETTQRPHPSWDGETRASTEKATKWGKESVSGILGTAVAGLGNNTGHP